jgi:DNA-binding transcriptional regulator GbsR (MarR family)
VLLLAACGGEDRLTKEEYEGEVRSLYADVQAAFQATRVAPAQLPGRIQQAQAELRHAADELEDLTPPEEVEEENEEVVEGLRTYAADLDELHAAAERRDEAAITAFNSGLRDNVAIERIAEAAEEMKHKGYDLGPIAEE